MADEFLTVTEIADLLKLNQQTVRNMIDRGELPAVRVGSRRVRVRRSDLDRFLEAGAIRDSREPEPAEVDEGSVTAWATFGPRWPKRRPRSRRPIKPSCLTCLSGL